MFLRHLCLLVFLVACATAIIDCSLEDTCFGEPYDCDPDSSCATLFHFDTFGNLHLFLRNFTDLNGYAAFAVNRHPDEIIEYFICLPYQGQRLRALAELGGLVLVAEQNLTGAVDNLGNNNFRCRFDVIELPNHFQQGQMFFVSKGTFDETLVIYDGDQLYNLERYNDSDEEFEEDEVLPVIHQIGSPVQHRVMEDVLTSDDKDTLSGAIKNLPKPSQTKDDIELEKMARSQRHVRSRSLRRDKEDEEDEEPRRRLTPKNRHYDEDEDVEDQDDQEEEGPRKRQNHKSRNRASRYEEDDEDSEEYRPRHHKNNRPTQFHDNDEEDIEDEEYEIPEKKNTKRRRHHDEDELDEKPRRKSFKGKKSNKNVDEEEYENEEDDDFYDDVSNSDAGNLITFSGVFIAGLIAADMLG